MSAPSVFISERYDDRSLIESIINSYFIIDYGFISTVNPDGTVDVIHAKKLKTMDGSSLQDMKTTGLEVLTLSCNGMAIKVDYDKGDKVLLLGLKNFVKNVDDVTSATETTSYIHYNRQTMKAMPLCVFNEDSKVTVEADDGTLKIDTDQKIELNGNDKQLVTWSELNTALSNFLTQLTVAMTTTPIIGNGSPQATWTGLPTSIDISAAKTKTVVTGG